MRGLLGDECPLRREFILKEKGARHTQVPRLGVLRLGAFTLLCPLPTAVLANLRAREREGCEQKRTVFFQ